MNLPRDFKESQYWRVEINNRRNEWDQYLAFIAGVLLTALVVACLLRAGML